MKEYNKKYHKEHRDEILDRKKKYYQENKQQENERSIKYYFENKDKFRLWSKESHRKFRTENRDKYNESIRIRNRNNRNKFLEMYGDKCAICGEEEYMFLTIDHIHNDGYKDMKKNGGKGSGCVLLEAIREYNPSKFQVLCYCCNSVKYKELLNAKVKSNTKHAKWNREYKKRIKDKFFEMYGTKCNCLGCKEDRRDYLTIDHIKRETNEDSLKSYSIAIKEYRPDIYQVLCYNCNSGRSRNKGKCPHIKDVKK
jgi:hypothetical protein